MVRVEQASASELTRSVAPAPEPLDDLERRTHDASRHNELDRLGMGPQGGLASTVTGHPLTEADQRAKLELLVRAAREIWA